MSFIFVFAVIHVNIKLTLKSAVPAANTGIGGPTGGNPSVFFNPGSAPLLAPAVFPGASTPTPHEEAKPKPASTKRKEVKKVKSLCPQAIELIEETSDLAALIANTPAVFTFKGERFTMFHLHCLPTAATKIEVMIENHGREAVVSASLSRDFMKPQNVAQSLVAKGSVIYEALSNWRKKTTKHFEEDSKFEIFLSLPFVAQRECDTVIYPKSARCLYKHKKDSTVLHGHQTLSSVVLVFKEQQTNYNVSTKVAEETDFFAGNISD